MADLEDIQQGKAQLMAAANTLALALSVLLEWKDAQLQQIEAATQMLAHVTDMITATNRSILLAYNTHIHKGECDGETE